MIRYTGVEFGESSIMPARPDETLKRRFGDCKDKSTLLVAMLRAAGFDAHVALLDTGFGPDPDPDLPGIDLFDHAIVFVGGEPPVWIDATAEYLRVGDLPAAVAGRLALVASAASTTLQRIPETPASRHRIEHARDYFLVERGRGRVVETISPEGGFEGDYRERYSTMDEGEVKKAIDDYVKRVYKARAPGEIRRTASTDFSKPFTLSFEGKETEVGETFADASTVRFPPADFVDRLENELPAEKKDKDAADGEAKTAPRTLPFRLREAFVDIWTTRVHPPPGFVPGEAPQVEDTHVGPVHFTRAVESAPDGAITFRATLDTGDRLVWTPQELADVRAWIAKVRSGETVQLVFEQAGYKALRAGQLQEAVRSTGSWPRSTPRRRSIAPSSPTPTSAPASARPLARRRGRRSSSTLVPRTHGGSTDGPTSTISSAAPSRRAPISPRPRRPTARRRSSIRRMRSLGRTWPSFSSMTRALWNVTVRARDSPRRSTYGGPFARIWTRKTATPVSW